MSEDDHPGPTGSDREIPPRDIDPAGSARGVDDHAATLDPDRKSPPNGAAED